jgi:hypothetical protein
VNRDEQKQGTGTAVMEEIVRFAEQHGRILVLDPAIIDKRHGTTSQARLRRFYKRFGFIENKGRNKNYEFRHLMIRYPDNKVNEAEYYKPDVKDTMGVKRADMPQIHKNHYQEMFRYLKKHGAKLSKGKADPRTLKATQGEFSDAGIAKMMDKSGNIKTGTSMRKPIIVSSDNYVMDGHHRWLAAYNLQTTIPTIRVSIPGKQLLDLLNNFKHSTQRDIYNEMSAMERACIEGGHSFNEEAPVRQKSTILQAITKEITNETQPITQHRKLD